MSSPHEQRPVFLISPASLHGIRAARLLARGRGSPLAERLGGAEGAPLGEVFTHISALYFRGKLTYARHFGGDGRAFVILPGFGLVPPEWQLTAERALRSRGVEVDPRQADYRRPLERDLGELLGRIDERERVVLLGSLATGKYLDVLEPLLGARLCYPRVFLGMGDMKRGSVLLQAVAADRPLDYRSVADEAR